MSEALFPLWVSAFLSTVLVEAPIYALALRTRLSLLHALCVGVALQAFTHPLFWLTWDRLGAWPYENYRLAVAIFESIIVVLEAALVTIALPPRRPWHRVPTFAFALLVSLIANASSVLVGILR